MNIIIIIIIINVKKFHFVDTFSKYIKDAVIVQFLWATL